jgi:uroporphyrinogen-III synthase
MSLAGLTVAITGSRRAQELANLITSFGGTPYVAPTVGIEEGKDVSKEVEGFINKISEECIDYVIFMTGPGVYSLISAAGNLGIDKKLIEALRQVTIIARSLKPEIALANHGIKTDIVPEENTAEGIVKLLMSRNIVGKKVVVLWHGSYSPIIQERLCSAGAQVFEFSTYKYSHELKESGVKILRDMGFNYIPPDEEKIVKLIEDIRKDVIIDAITFTSPPSARDLFSIAKFHGMNESLKLSLNNNVIVVSVGPSTRKAIEENGVQVDVMPRVYKMGAMVKALVDYMSQSDPPKRRRKHS